MATASGRPIDRTAPGDSHLAPRRPTQSELAAARKAKRQDDVDRAIAAGKLVVRQMTPAERAARAFGSPISGLALQRLIALGHDRATFVGTLSAP